MAKEPKKPGKAMIPWEQELAAAAKSQSEAPKSGGGERNFISLEGGKMSFGGNKLKDNRMDAIILDFAYVNAYYDKPYNPKNPVSPSCFALARNQDDLAPHEDAEDAQHDQCAGCPNNEWGSRGDGGQGKACKNAIRLTLIAAGDAEKLDKADVAYLMVPPTSLKAFGNFYKEECCDESGDPAKPTYAFITTISGEADPYIKLSFEQAQAVTRDQFYDLKAKVKKMGDDVLFPFPKQEDLPKREVKGNPNRKKKF